jgi:hypothetical protein
MSHVVSSERAAAGAAARMKLAGGAWTPCVRDPSLGAALNQSLAAAYGRRAHALATAPLAAAHHCMCARLQPCSTKQRHDFSNLT